MIPPWFPTQQIPSLKAYQDFFKITEGGFGEIYSAKKQEKIKTRPVIIKRLRTNYCSDPLKRRIMEQEARVLKSLNHPQIPKYHEGFISDQECFIIMDQILGLDPEKLFRNARLSGKSIPASLGFAILIGASEALSEVHSLGWVHGDIKLANILVTPELETFLIDFSMAGRIGDQPKTLGGTFHFMPPERFAQKPLSPQIDLFPLSLILYYLVTGEMIIKANTIQEIFGFWLQREHIPKIKKENFPQALETLLIKNLSLEPQKRVQKATDLKQELIHLAGELKIDLTPSKNREIYQKLSKIS